MKSAPPSTKTWPPRPATFVSKVQPCTCGGPLVPPPEMYSPPPSRAEFWTIKRSRSVGAEPTHRIPPPVAAPAPTRDYETGQNRARRLSVRKRHDRTNAAAVDDLRSRVGRGEYGHIFAEEVDLFDVASRQYFDRFVRSSQRKAPIGSSDRKLMGQRAERTWGLRKGSR